MIYILYHRDIEIGILTYENDTWLFEYFDSFKNQNNLNVIINFPNVNKQYASKKL